MPRAEVLEVNQFGSLVPLSHINHSIITGVKAICKETILSTSESIQCTINNLNGGSRRKQNSEMYTGERKSI